jgi:hypothetical protein
MISDLKVQFEKVYRSFSELLNLIKGKGEI